MNSNDNDKIISLRSATAIATANDAALIATALQSGAGAFESGCSAFTEANNRYEDCQDDAKSEKARDLYVAVDSVMKWKHGDRFTAWKIENGYSSMIRQRRASA